MDREKEPHGPCELKPSSVSKPLSLTLTAPTATTFTYARMAKDAATGDVVIKHHDPPKMLNCNEKGKAGLHTIDHHTDRYRLSVVLVNEMASSVELRSGSGRHC